jgi:hypothetical protein
VQSARFSLPQFAGAFEIRNAEGKPHIIIGGQAVNYWAETYLSAEPELAAFLPFVSKDIDFIGELGDVRAAAQTLGLPAKLPHPKMRTAFAGAVIFRIGGERANIEFVRNMPGVSEAEINRWAVSSERAGRAIRVADPVSLLACKLHLALTVDQTNRRDADHVHILMLCTRAFLRETLRGAADGALPVRGWLGAVERVLKLAESKLGRRAARALELDWNRALPLVEIAASRLPPVLQFREKRLAQWRARPLNQAKRKPVSD